MKLCPKCQKQFSSEANFCPVDAARLVPVPEGAEASSGSSAPQQFELGDRLGGTRTGAVFRATDKAAGTPVALKLVAPSVAAAEGAGQRLERELHQLERVQSTGIAKVLSSGRSDRSGRSDKAGEQFWVAMELFEGAHTLADEIGRHGPMAAPRAAELIEAIGTALIDAAHGGVVHRDLAPKNVLVAGNQVKLINFSIAVSTSEKLTGVPEFVAPEQVEGRPADQRSNLYSLGALYYYMLTGKTVFEGVPEAVYELHRTGTIAPPSQIAPNAIGSGSALELAIMRALDRSPSKRFLTVRQFVDEVVRVSRGGASSATPAPAVKEIAATLPAGSAAGAAPGPARTVLGMAPAMMPPGLVAPVVAAAQPANTAAPSGQVASPKARVAAASAPPPTASVKSQSAPAVAAASSAPVTASSKNQAASPVVAAPVVAPQKPAAAAGKKKAVDDESNKGKFRETLWFKKGDLDTQAAIAAAEERARTGADPSVDKVDTMPIDERYKDDGSLTRGDTERYSLRTGATQTLRALPADGNSDSANVSPDALIGEMKGGRSKVIGAVVVAVLALILIIVFAAR